MAKNNPEVNADVIAIEKRLCLYPLVLLRFIRWKFTRKLKPNSNSIPPPVVEMEANRMDRILSWAATILLLVGIGSNTISCSKQAIRL
jgi:hypothetical protein